MSGSAVQVTAHFQAIVDVQQWTVSGYEVLSRFSDGLSPLAHLDQARHSGQLCDFEVELVAQGVAAAQSINTDNLVTLNISAATMTDPRLDQVFASLRTGLWGLEVLETSARQDCVSSLKARAQDLGCKLLVDDAGAGNADSCRIITMRPDIVKIDRSLCAAAPTDPAAYATVESLILAGRQVGATVLLEGVETASQLKMAQDLGIDLAQGFYFGKAVPVTHVASLETELFERLGISGTN